ncbi:MAG: DUF1800 domain-containing protein [Acidimicrobiales bacterium]
MRSSESRSKAIEEDGIAKSQGEDVANYSLWKSRSKLAMRVIRFPPPPKTERHSPRHSYANSQPTLERETLVNEREQTLRAIRRLRFAPRRADIDTFGSLDPTQAVQALVAVDQPFHPSATDPAATHNWDSDSYDSLQQWWFDVMLSPTSGLHERMVWFWHGHLTSSANKTSRNLLFAQQQLFRRHALGNFRDLIHDITVDPAMLRYLDGDRSKGSNPNENYARELMELFAVGVGHYEEPDIRAAARGLSGWVLTDGGASFDPERFFNRQLTFLGERRRWDARSIVDKVVDHPACAPFIVTKIFRFLAGSTPEESVVERLAALFVANNLEIQPLIDALLDESSFLAAPPTRARQPVEWLAATATALGYEAALPGASQHRVESWWFDQLGQVPLQPPNVAGWPDDDRWVSAGQVLARANLLSGVTLPEATLDTVASTVDDVLYHCCLDQVSDTTRSTLDAAVRAQPAGERRLELLLTLTILSPEFALA